MIPLNKRILLPILISLIVVISLFFLRENIHVSDTQVHSLKYFDRAGFFNSLKLVNEEKVDSKEKIYGGVIPHHLYASNIIADFISRLSKQNPETIILIGPNHKELGEFNALTSMYSWATETGLVEADKILIKKLLDNNVVKVDEKALPSDHSVAVLMPYINYYLPDTKVVPILLSGFMNEKEIAFLSERLLSQVSERVVLVAAVDFSHNLMSSEAKVKDKVTLKLINERNYEGLLNLGNEHLDSSPSIVTVLMVMQTLDKKLHVLENTNSGEMQDNNSIPTTSYFSIAFY